MTRLLSLAQQQQNLSVSLPQCEHRTVSKEGRIICAKISLGDNSVSPGLCHTCPFRAVNCVHLCFSLQQSSPSPLIVRFGGHTEVWNDALPEIRFQQAACSARVVPIQHPRACAGCPLRQPLHSVEEPPAVRQRVARPGKVVPFPQRETIAATG